MGRNLFISKGETGYKPIGDRLSDSGAEGPGPKVIKLFSSSAQLRMKFQLLIHVEIVKISRNSGSVLNN